MNNLKRVLAVVGLLVLCTGSHSDGCGHSHRTSSSSYNDPEWVYLTTRELREVDDYIVVLDDECDYLQGGYDHRDLGSQVQEFCTYRADMVAFDGNYVTMEDPDWVFAGLGDDLAITLRREGYEDERDAVLFVMDEAYALYDYIYGY